MKRMVIILVFVLSIVFACCTPALADRPEFAYDSRFREEIFAQGHIIGIDIDDKNVPQIAVIELFDEWTFVVRYGNFDFIYAVHEIGGQYDTTTNQLHFSSYAEPIDVGPFFDYPANINSIVDYIVMENMMR